MPPNVLDYFFNSSLSSFCCCFTCSQFVRVVHSCHNEDWKPHLQTKILRCLFSYQIYFELCRRYRVKSVTCFLPFKSKKHLKLWLLPKAVSQSAISFYWPLFSITLLAFCMLRSRGVQQLEPNTVRQSCDVWIKYEHLLPSVDEICRKEKWKRK